MDANHNIDVVDVACFLERFFYKATRAFFGLTTITRASLHFFYIKLHVRVPDLYVHHYSTVQACLLPFISFATTCICEILERYYYSSQVYFDKGESMLAHSSMCTDRYVRNLTVL
jgi:hypothetical protein